MLDPLITLNAQNQRNMMENTQRSSEVLRSNVLRETKDKTRKRVHGSVDIESEMSDLSGDLFGGMDDLFDGGGGGGGNAELFRQMWEEDVESHPDPRQQAGDTLFDDGQGTRLIDTEDKAGPEPELDFRSLIPENEPAEPAAAEANQETSEKQDNEPSSETSSEVEDSALGGDREDPETRTVTVAASPGEFVDEPEPPVPSESTSAPRRETVRIEAPEVGQTAKVTVISEEKLDLSSSRASSEESSAPEKPLASTSLGSRSFLDTSEGFIFHESLEETLDLSASKTARKKAEKVEVPKELAQVLDNLIQGDKTSAAYDSLRLVLSRFGKGVLSLCAANDVKVCLLPLGQLAAYPAVRNLSDRPDDFCGWGAYLPETHTCLVGEENFTAVPEGFHPALFFMAMAWDHCLGDGGFASMQSPAVKANFDACRQEYPGHRFADSLSAVSPVYYFAQSAEAYLSANDCLNPLWSREDLYDFDRMMYDYLEYLFRQANCK